MYTPAFLEIYLGFGAVLVWGRWLRDRTTAPPWVLRSLGWGCGVVVLVGQLVAVNGLVQSTADAGAAGVAQLIDASRWGSAAVVCAALGVESILTVGWWIAQRKPK